MSGGAVRGMQGHEGNGEATVQGQRQRRKGVGKGKGKGARAWAGMDVWAETRAMPRASARG